jgi:hydroxyethylthiazole kinase-like uncharacterized protein yjeF
MLEPINLSPDNLCKANWQRLGQQTLPVLSVNQIRLLEKVVFEQIDPFLLMQAAGVRAALRIVELVLQIHKDNISPVTDYLVFAGPGHNGGDACIVAGELTRLGFNVRLFHVTDENIGPKDRLRAVKWAHDHGVNSQIFNSQYPLPKISTNTIVIDGLLGIACDRPPSGSIATLIQHINTSDSYQIYSLDCPSGLNCDSGLTPGIAIKAHATFCFLACKNGLVSGQGKVLSGELWIDSLNCDSLIAGLAAKKQLGRMIHAISHSEQLFRLPQRFHNHHKGNFGNIAILGGKQGMFGAGLLAARTSLMLGSGRVAISFLDETDIHLPDVQVQGQKIFVDLLFPEIMNKSIKENLEFSDTVVIGPGLGQCENAVALLHTLFQQDKGINLVLDADALNLIAKDSNIQNQYQTYRAKNPNKAMVFTPHPLEAARLLQTTSNVIQNDRPDAAKKIASEFNCTVVLKGSGSLICEKELFEINYTGGPALSTAGSGDVLAGSIAAMLGQGLSGFEAAAFAVYLHGLVIEPEQGEDYKILVSHASEIAQRMKTRFNYLLNQSTCFHH